MKKISKKLAQVAYRRAWMQRCLASTLDGQRASERVMDALQETCVDNGGPGPEWESFVDTLPGYRELWAQMVAQCDL